MGDDVLAGRYRRIDRIGAGGMGEVWLAEDVLLQRRVAIKRLLADGDRSDHAALERMMREARLAARLDHPNAVTIHDVVLHDGHPHLIMQYVGGTSLSERIEQGPLTLADAAHIVASVAGALADAHELGIVHRDVKPGNILLDGRGRAMLADFGIARSPTDTKLTLTGAFIGTPAYLAPELLHGGPATPASDVYALGATLYAALEGSAPFDDGMANALTVLARVLTQAVPPPTRAGQYTGLVVAMLAADPDSRPTALDVNRQLRAVRGAASPTIVSPWLPRVEPSLPEPAVEEAGDEPDNGAGDELEHELDDELDDELEDEPDDDVIASLVGAIDYARVMTRGSCPPYDDWEELLVGAIMPFLNDDDRVDLFVPALFAIDLKPRADLPRRMVRSLDVIPAGACVLVGDRMICAWFAKRNLSVTLEYAQIRAVTESVHKTAGDSYRALEIDLGRFTWRIMFDDELDVDSLREILRGRLHQRVRPEWQAGRVARWLITDGRGGWDSRPGWPEESQ